MSDEVAPGGVSTVLGQGASTANLTASRNLGLCDTTDTSDNSELRRLLAIDDWVVLRNDLSSYMRHAAHTRLRNRPHSTSPRHMATALPHTMQCEAWASSDKASLRTIRGSSTVRRGELHRTKHFRRDALICSVHTGRSLALSVDRRSS